MPSLASTFLTQLRVGPKLVSTTALPGVYTRWGSPLAPGGRPTLAGIVAFGAALSTTPDGAAAWDSTTSTVGDSVPLDREAVNP